MTKCLFLGELHE